jgi:hypothetical protein
MGGAARRRECSGEPTRSQTSSGSVEAQVSYRGTLYGGG